MKRLFQLARHTKKSSQSDLFDMSLPPEDEVIRIHIQTSTSYTPPLQLPQQPGVVRRKKTPLIRDGTTTAKWYYEGFGRDTSPEDRVQIVNVELDIAKDNVKDLSQTLRDIEPEDLNGDSVIGLHRMCRLSQKFIASQISWAEQIPWAEQIKIATNPQHDSIPTMRYQDMLKSLRSVNKDLLDVLREYEELERVAIEREIERVDRVILGHDPVNPLTPSHLLHSSSHRPPSYLSHTSSYEGESLSKLIDHLVLTEKEDPATILQVCKRASQSKSGAIEAALALKLELHDATYQFAAARLWTVMMRNASDFFASQCAKSDFLSALEMMLERAPPLTREMVLDIIAAVAYFNDKEPGFRSLWKKVKPALSPAENCHWRHYSSPRTITLQRTLVDDGDPMNHVLPLLAYDHTSQPSQPDDRTPSPQPPIVPPKYSLVEFPRYTSIIDRPAEWLQKSHEHIGEYITHSRMDSFSQSQCRDLGSDSILLPYLFTYLYETVGDLAALRTCVGVWTSQDLLSALCKHQVASDMLLLFIRDSAHARPDDADTVRNIVALDVDFICCQLHGIVKDASQYRRLINLRGDEAQALLDLFQLLLDFPKLDKIFRSPFLNAMLRLSSRSSLFPSRLLQKQVSLEGTDAITAGQFGDVWKGRFRGEQVAVKVLKLYLNSDLVKHTKKVLHETLIWRQLRHPNVLPFLCLHHVNNNEMRLGLVSPWMQNGNVKEFLLHTQDVDRVFLTTDVAEGLKYLHTMQPSVVHGDLKAVNILISDSRRARLADFGLSTASDSQALKLSSFSFGLNGGTPRWMAPELLDGRQAITNTQTDVYAFACVCYEIFSGTFPFPELNDYPVMLRVMQGERPSRPVKCENWGTPCIELGLSDALWQLIERCWAADAQKRPSMHSVVRKLPTRKGRSITDDSEYQFREAPIASDGPWENLIAWAGCS
ncbi:hypothetical protein DXG01_003643 [Tephrocybe rancida]|nr:hypothetical protein DXG01_003643 [Tephrocybe rancida]